MALGRSNVHFMNSRSPSGKQVQKLRDRLREQTGQAILAAAEEVFAEEGLSAHMGDIAARAGLAVGTLYNHFKDRDALLSGLLASRGEETIAALDRALAAAGRRPFRTQLAALLGTIFEHFEAHRRFFGMVLASGEHKSGPGPSPIFQELYLRIEKVMKAGVREKALRSDAASICPALLIGMIRGLVLRQIHFVPGAPLLNQVELLTDVFLNGAGARA